MPKQIEIDLDVNRELEVRRMSFDETPNQILRRSFNLDRAVLKGNTAPSPPVRQTRRTGAYQTKILGLEITGMNLKEILRKALLAAEGQQAGFIEKLSRHRTSRGRHIVGRKPEEIYPGKPQLHHCAERLDQRWWFDTNVSFNQAQRYLGVIASNSGSRETVVLHKD
jgi:hypothetical protein